MSQEDHEHDRHKSNTNAKQETPVCLDMFGHVSIDDKELIIKENLPLKSFRVKCFKVTVNLLEKIGVPYFITDGTLLSVWRDSGVLIPHDTDTDLGIMEEDMGKVWSNRHLLPEGYGLDSRSKVTGDEWPMEKGDFKFDPSGSKGLVMKMKVYDNSDPGPLKYCSGPWCSTDIFTFRITEEDENVLARNYLADQGMGRKRYPKNAIYPLKRYVFEGIKCWGPSNPERILKIEYGYLGRDCYYDKDEQLYKKIAV